LTTFYLQHKPSGDILSAYVGDRGQVEENSHKFNRDEKDQLFNNLAAFKNEMGDNIKPLEILS
jgi:hypothetical protein